MPHDTASAVTDRDIRASAAIAVNPVHLVAGIALLFGLDNLLLLRFLGMASPLPYLAEGAVLAGLLWGLSRAPWEGEGLPLSRWVACLGLALVLLVWGGEGRFLYANLDWQVRDAALRDMIVWPWPFAYTGFATEQILRAPIGMYLVPALFGKLGGQTAADMALLLQNSLLLGTVFALGSLLFPTARGRRVAAVVVVLFSGMDTLGIALGRPYQLLPLDRSIDGWAGIQYSSHITMAFWVPQHAMVGWIGALLFLLWRTGRLPLGAFLAILPLSALWSPLGLMGTMPFAAIAGVETLVRRNLRLRDVALPSVALLVAAAGLFYLKADGGRVGAHFYPIDPVIYGVVELTEVLPFAGAAIFLLRGSRFGWVATMTVTACLLFFPFLQIGHNVDFMMRASIPALAILSVMMADLVLSGRESLARSTVIVCLAIGALTPARELWRAVLFNASPPPLCDVSQAWDQNYGNYGKDTYFAGVDTLPAPLRPAHLTPAPPTKLARCWSRPWRTRRFG